MDVLAVTSRFPEGADAVRASAAPRLRFHVAQSAGAFLVLSLCLMAGLFATVHRRDLGAVLQTRQTSMYRVLMRNDDTVIRWLNKGFVHDGGMIFLSRELAKSFFPKLMPDDSLIKSDSVFPYRSSTAAWLIPLYLIEKVYTAFGREFSHGLVTVYNQLTIAFIAAALGFLAMQIASHMGLRRFHAFLIGASCLVIFQTFPVNLWVYWECNPLWVPLFFAVLLLCLEFDSWNRRRSAVRQVLRGLLATATVFGEPVTGGLFIAFYLVVRAVLDEGGVRPRDVTVLLVIPVMAVISYLTLQQVLVRSHYNSAFFVGSTMPFRTGLDGDTRYYVDHWDLLIRPMFKPGHPLATIVWWPWLFAAGVLSAASLLARYRSAPALREPLRLLFATVGLYLPFAMVMSQAAAIHPYQWDICLVVPCVLSAFCLFPAWIEARGRTGLAVFLTLCVAVAYSFVQLRTYALAFPLAV